MFFQPGFRLIHTHALEVFDAHEGRPRAGTALRAELAMPSKESHDRNIQALAMKTFSPAAVELAGQPQRGRNDPHMRIVQAAGKQFLRKTNHAVVVRAIRF
jgi:hypothetical protein